VTRKVAFKPTVFMVSPEPTEFRSFDETYYLTPVTTGNIWETRDWLKQYKETKGFLAFGNPRAEYDFISRNFPSDVPYDTRLIYVANLDIEVDSENGEAALNAAAATEQVISITIERDGHYFVWGLKDYVPHIPDVTFTKCRDELELLASFLNFWTSDYPDVITGWNIAIYDIPYLLHRITRLFGEDRAKELSPWGKVSDRRIIQFGREHTVYALQGIDTLDYMDLFKKFSRKAAQESYKLNDIAYVIAKEQKVEHGYPSLAALYRENPQLFYEYNIHDTTLIRKIDAKEKLLELAFTLAYQSHTNPSDVFSQVRMWTQIIDDFLLRENKFSSIYRTGEDEKERFEGAYVKDAASGLFHWVASFDATSLYPSLIMQHNISPDTFIEPEKYDDVMREVMAQRINVDTLFHKQVDTRKLIGKNVTLTANGHLFRTDKKGFLPRIIEDLFARRQGNKKKMLAAEKAAEALKADPNHDPAILTQTENDKLKFDALQNAMKVCLNSSFGALGNNFFFHFDVRLAEAITITGKLSNLWATRAVNDYLNRVLKTDDVDYVIAGDTDSIYLHLGPLITAVYGDRQPEILEGIDFMGKVCGGPIAKVLDQAFDDFGLYMHVMNQKIYFKREALADRAIWSGGKKRYIVNVWDSEGVRYNEPEVKVKGFEMVKSSHPKLVRDKMKDAVKIILNKTEADLWKFVADFKKEFYQQPPEVIAFPRGCHGITRYMGHSGEIYKSGTPQHIKAAILYNHLVKTKGLTKSCTLIRDGDKIRFVRLKIPNPAFEDVIAFPYEFSKELGLHDYIDYEAMFDKTFVEPLTIILDAIGWKVKRENTLKSLFKRKTDG
jgi:DNA polymerase elongation subunit (family B)